MHNATAYAASGDFLDLRVAQRRSLEYCHSRPIRSELGYPISILLENFPLSQMEAANVLDQIQMFLELSNFERTMPSIIEVTFSADGKYSTRHPAIHVRFSENQLRGQKEISSLITFTVLDALIDLWQPEVEGKSFKTRYRNLPKSNDREIVIAGTYRIMRLMRNALVHDRSSIANISGEIVITLDPPEGIKGGVVSKLTCKNDAVQYLNSIILLLLINRTTDDNYLRGILAGYYACLLSKISKFEDDIQEPLPSVISPDRLKPLRRYRVEVIPSEAQAESDGYKVTRVPLHSMEAGWTSDEFVIRREGEVYIVPGECLGNGDYISLKLMADWKVSARNSLRPH